MSAGMPPYLARCVAVLLAAGCLAGSAQAQVRYDSSAVTVRTLPDEVLQAYRADPAYRYDAERAPETWWDRLKDRLWERLVAPLLSPGLGPLRRALFYLLVAGLVAFALLRLLRMEAGGLFYSRHAPGAVRLHEADAELPADDLERLVEEAVARQDYRRAVRLSYLRLLKHLSARGLIVWRPDKTNHDYAVELGRSSFRAAFARLTAVFDYVWYGDFPVDAALFARIHDDVDALIRETDG